MPTVMLRGVFLFAAVVSAVFALPTDNVSHIVNAPHKAVPSEDVLPRPSNILVGPPVRQVEEANGDAGRGPSSLPLPLPVRSNAVPGRLPGTITFPNERLQQADDRLDADQDGSSWESLYEGCGSTKNCLGIPADCDQGRNCRAIVTAQWINSELHLKMRASDSKWVAVGFGETNFMFDTSVVECVNDPIGTISAHMSYTPPRPNRDCIRVSKPDPLSIPLLNSKSMNGDIYCEVFRVNDTRVNNKVYNLGQSSYYLQLAAGKKIKPDGTGVFYHGDNCNAAARSTVLTDYVILGSVNNWPMKMHGALMVLAWIFAATAGSLAARYFKAAWGKATICGKAMWFSWHRLLMLLTVALHVTAVVAALIFLQGWSSSSGLHGILGGVTTGLALVQGAAGMLRPGPDHKQRPLFNWGHRGMGFATHFLAVLTIFLAVDLARLPSSAFWVLGLYVVFYVALHAVHSLTEVKSYYFIIILFGSAVFAIAMLVLVVIGSDSS